MELLVIVVTYNGLNWVDRCFGSLRHCEVPLKVLAVDNGSTDGTVEAIASRFPEVEIVRTGLNRGFGQANNVGMRMALDRGSEFVFLLNQDAWLTTGSLEKLVAAAERAPDFGILSPLHLNGQGDALDKYFAECCVPAKCPGLLSDMALARIRSGPYPVQFVNAAAWLLTRHCISTVGGFSPLFFHYAEDDNYVARMIHHGLRIGVLPAARVHHDRSERGANPYFDDKVKLLTRRALLDYADPRRKQNLAVDRREWRIKLCQAWLFGRSQDSRTARQRLGILGRPEIFQAIAERSITRIAGPTFL